MHNTTLLCGNVGSRAYGMETPDSDNDQFGVFIAPTELFLGLRHPLKETHRATTEDHIEHEVRHFLELALASNPAALEILYLPSYNVTTPQGEELVGMRRAFLAAPNVRARYLGYAQEQLARMQRQTPADDVTTVRKRAKNGRHLLRLLDQGERLLATGELMVRVENPQRYFNFGARVAADPQYAIETLETAREKYAEIRSPLPSEPDRARVEQWLRNLRLTALREAIPSAEHFPWPDNG